MDTYVCLLMDDEKHIVTVDALTAASEAEAVQKARDLKDANPKATGFELWHRGKKIATAAKA